MSFLQPMLLAGLPLVALPIVIHLINQRRYRTVQWAAMMFLLAANRMSRGYARIRQWLIMAFRMLAVAGLTFAVSRPLAGGWLGVTAGGRADTTIVVLDRSPSMRQGAPGGGGTKLETGARQLARALETLGSSRWVLAGGAGRPPIELDSASALPSSTSSGPTAAASDMPGLLETVRDYIKANRPGRTEVWICSDMRRNDWRPEDGRWSALRDAFLQFPQGVRFHLLAYPGPAPGNVSVRVTDVRRRKAADGAELLVSLRLTRDGPAKGTYPAAESIPVAFEIDGARSEVSVEMAGPRSELKDHRIPLARGRERGRGRVSIPADANAADNEYHFAFDAPAPRRSVVVADDPQTARVLQLAAAIAPDPGLECSAEAVAADRLADLDRDAVALLLWQSSLPEGDAARRVRSFLDRGGRAVFFPPRSPGAAEFLGVRWTAWADGPPGDASVDNWRGDQDLLAHTLSGAALPVGQIQVRKSCGLSGEFTPLATLRGGAPLLVRATTNAGGAYFCATTPAPGDSSLADGVVLYILVHRALAGGAEALERTRQVDAGAPPPDDPVRWKRLAGAGEGLSTDYPYQAGVYDSGGRLLAVNRPAAEDAAPVVPDGEIAKLFDGLDFARVDDREGNVGGLIREVWRLFLVAMMCSLTVEAGLCLPRPTRPAGGLP